MAIIAGVASRSSAPLGSRCIVLQVHRRRPAFEDILGACRNPWRAAGRSGPWHPVGYLSSQMYAFFMPALLLVYAIGRSTSTLAGEEEDHTLDLLLAQPISRTALYVQKVGGVALGIAVLAIAVAVPVIALADWSELKVPAANLWAATAQLFAFVLFLGMLAMTVSASIGRRAAGVGVAAGLAFVTYLLDGFGKSIEWLEPWRVLTPWYWYDIDEALSESMPWTSFAVLLGATLITGALGLWGFNRRNLRS